MGSAIQPLPFGKYFLLERIAVGGMAEIYKAKYRADAGIEKTLVIKKILPHLAQDDEFITMFRDEAALTVRLNHANIVQVFDFGKNGDDYFLAMEYVQGQNLRQVMRRCQELGAPVPVPFALFAANEVAKGLSYAHSRKDDSDSSMGIVHRDITPSNILVSYEGEFKIADFGIAKAISRAGGTQAGMIKGKASYLAPEQVKGAPVDARADLFSLGAVIWEMVVGRKLFSGDGDFEIMNKITHEQILPPSARNKSVPPGVDAVVMKCLERDPQRRYLNAGALQKDLTVVLGQLASGITAQDVSAFNQRLFKNEIDAEREASKSYARLVIDENAVLKAARDQATLNKPAPEDQTKTPIARKPQGGKGLALAAVAIAGLAVVGLGVVAGLKFGVIGGTPTPEPTRLALATPIVTDTVPVVVVTATPVETPAETATPTAEPVHSKAPHPTATPKSGGTGVKPTPTRVAVVATPAPSGAMGIVILNSEPWGEIFVDGKDTERQTPAFDLKLPEGPHQIRLVNSVQRLEASFSITVDSKTPQKKIVKLAPAP